MRCVPLLPFRQVRSDLQLCDPAYGRFFISSTARANLDCLFAALPAVEELTLGEVALGFRG